MLLNHHRLTLDIHTGHAVQLDTLYMHYMLPCKLYTQHTLQIQWTRCTYTECTLHTLHTHALHTAHTVHTTHTLYIVHTHNIQCTQTGEHCTHYAHSTHAELLWGTLNSFLSLCSNWVHCGLQNFTPDIRSGHVGNIYTLYMQCNTCCTHTQCANYTNSTYCK